MIKLQNHPQILHWLSAGLVLSGVLRWLSLGWHLPTIVFTVFDLSLLGLVAYVLHTRRHAKTLGTLIMIETLCFWLFGVFNPIFALLVLIPQF